MATPHNEHSRLMMELSLIQSYFSRTFEDVRSVFEDGVVVSMKLDGEPYRLRITPPWLESQIPLSIEARLDKLYACLYLLNHHEACLDLGPTGEDIILPLHRVSPPQLRPSQG